LNYQKQCEYRVKWTQLYVTWPIKYQLPSLANIEDFGQARELLARIMAK
jgi:hypothetical protein